MGFLEKLFHYGHSHQLTDIAAARCEYPDHCPIVTLYFDVTLCRTIAVLSKRKESLVVYFMGRVAQGSCWEKSLLYYELDGYIRENLATICQHEGFFPEAIAIAVGALALSDASQKDELIKLRLETMRLRHTRKVDVVLLEAAIEIARLHRLTCDLDVLDVYCMRQTCKVLGRIAARMAKSKMRSLNLHVTPFVDGVLIPCFVPRPYRYPRARMAEAGRFVEYHQCHDISLQATEMSGTFIPAAAAEFSWNLSKEGIVGIGQKLVISWTVDFFDGRRIKSKTLPVATFHDCPRQGTFHYKILHASATMNNEQSDASLHQCSSLIQVELSFLALVRVFARSMVDNLGRSYNQQFRRPLLDHEIEYLEMIRNACSF